ncbi:MAG: hypothetical protein OER88_01720 [Planctomycetota bacterium]|nr:hypothetical protein [Planctomycetota bacterium]
MLAMVGWAVFLAWFALVEILQTEGGRAPSGMAVVAGIITLIGLTVWKPRPGGALLVVAGAAATVWMPVTLFAALAVIAPAIVFGGAALLLYGRRGWR